MRKPSNNANITVSEETHNRLKKIRDHNNWTYTETINQLCELYFQDNQVEFIVSYELHFEKLEDNKIYNKVFPFKVRFGSDNFTIEYLNERESTYNINEWGLPHNIKNAFYEFVKKDCARCLLLHMPIGLLFDDFEIYKVNVNIR